MPDEAWFEILRRVLDMPTASKDALNAQYVKYADDFGGWTTGHVTADEAFRLGLERASLALA